MPNSIPTLRKSAYNAQGGRCCYCGRPMWLKQPKAFAEAHNFSLKQARSLQCTAEHLLARTDGGGDSKDNIAAACLYCNRKRHQRKSPPSPERFRSFVEGRVSRGRWFRL